MRHRNLLLHTTVLCGLALVPGMALANPTGGSVAGGSASISTSGNTLTVQQTSSRAIINWNSFDIGAGETTQFQQPNSSAITLNRISQNSPSQINGQLTANGNIILINPNGVLFGAGSQVNVGGLVVSTADTDNTAFMNGGRLSFSTPGNPNAQIINQGTITVAQAGLVGLVAPHVENQGIITATLGKVQLASGDGFVLDMAGDGITQVVVSPQVAQQLVANSGLINAPGGTIRLSAAAAADLVNALVTNTGELRADTFQQQGGTIQLTAANGTVNNSGSINARGNNPGDSGGTVNISAANVQQDGNINVSGQASGGNVNISFSNSYSDTHSSGITANAVTGNGGSINVTGTTPASQLTASGTYTATSQSAQGGSINVTAGNVNLTGAMLDASGASGGQVAVAATQAVAIDSAGIIRADGTQDTGGTITLDGATLTVEGLLSAMGISQGGSININFVDSYSDTIDATLTVASSEGAGGGVYVTGDDNAQLTASGTYLADGSTTGGTIGMLTQEGNIMLLGAYLSATGQLGGGAIRIGGDFHGANTLRRSRYTYVDAGTTINASATDNGNGGTVAVWADTETDFYGTIYARGGPNGGNGGFVETSGHVLLSLTDSDGNSGMVYANAPHGAGGTLLLDPADVTINGSADSGMSGSGPAYTPSGGVAESTILNTEIQTFLNAGTNVTITTGGDAAAGTNNGQITVASAITASTGAGSLTLSAYSNIVINAAITLDGGNLVLRADNADNGTGTGNGSGYIAVNAAIATGGGNITMGGGNGTLSAGSGYAVGNAGQATGVYVNNVAVNAGSGNVIVNGQGYNSTGNNNYGVYVTGSSGTITTNNNGTIAITGTGGGTGSSNSDWGVYLASSAVISDVNGNLTISGTGTEGVYLASSSTIETTGSGNISISGTVQTVSGSDDVAVDIENNSVIQAAGTGTITLTGNGGTDARGGSYGVYIATGSSITGGGSAVTVTGTGGDNSSNGNGGVQLYGGSITNNGSGDITITGTASGTGTSSDNYGVSLSTWTSTPSVISTAGGNLTINATGGGTGGQNYGFYVLGTGSTVKTTGSGSLNISATGGTGSLGNNYGIYVSSANGIQTTGTGTMTVNGTGGNGSGNGNYGIYVDSGHSITGSGGAMTIAGTGVVGIDAGVYVNGGTISNTGGGNLTVNGTAAGINSVDFAVRLDGGGTVSTSNGTLAINGTGAEGVFVNSGSTVETTGSGNLFITGNDSTSSFFGDFGVDIESSSVIKATGTGAITIAGNGGGSGTGFNGGVYVSGSTIAGSGGNVTVTGTAGNNSGNTNEGVYVGGATISNTGAGSISITGTGGGTGNSEYGIDLENNPSIYATGNGALTLTGVGANGSAGIYSTNSSGNNTIGGASDSGAITLIADTLNFASATPIETTGAVTFKPYTASTSIGVAGGSGTLQVTSSILGAISGESGITIGNTSDSATMNVDSYGWGVPLTLDSGAGNVNITNGSGDLTFSHALNINTTTGNVTLTAQSDIATNGGGNITTQGGNVIFDSNTGGSGGAIVMNTGSSITSNGGNITLGGGNGAITAGILNADGTIQTAASGFAVGDATYTTGVSVNSLNAGSGNIIINGKGYSSGSGNHENGVSVGSIITAGGGNNSISGTGGGGTGNYNDGILMGSVTAQNGTITLIGTAGGSGNTTIANAGVKIEGSGSSVSVNGSGSIYINGTGGPNALGFGNSDGIEVGYAVGGVVSTNSGNIVLNGASTSGSVDDFGVKLINGTVKSTGGGNITIIGHGPNTTLAAITDGGGNNTIGGTGDSGSITLKSDTIYIPNTTIQTTGTITFEPYSTSTTIGVAGATGTLQVTDSILNSTTAGGITIGSTSDTGAMDVGANSWNAPASLYNGSGGITLAGMQTMNGNTFLAYTTGNLTLNNGAGISSTASGNAIVAAAGGSFINDSGSATPFTTPNGRFIGYSFRPSDDTNSLSVPQTITGYTYAMLPPSRITSGNGYSSTDNTWVYTAPSSVPPTVTNPPTPAPAPAPAPSPAPAPAPAPSSAPAPAPAPSPAPAPAPAPAPSPAPAPEPAPAPAPAPAPTPASSPAPSPAPAPPQGGSNTSSMPPVQGANADSHFQIGTIPLSDGDNKPAANPDTLTSNAPAPSDPPIAAPAKFKALDEQLNNINSEPEEEVEAAEPAGQVTQSVNTVTKETRKIMKHITVPGVASVGAASVGYVLLFGRTMYNALAMLLGLGLGSQKLDPANLLEYWEREGRKRDRHEKKVEDLFG